MSYETMALASKADTDRIISDALDGKYPADGVYENDDCRLYVGCGGQWVSFAHKKVIPYSAIEAFMGNGELVLV